MTVWTMFWNLNLPNKLTMLRIFVVPIILACLLSEKVWGQFAALLLFIAAALTDYWDGKLARKRQLVTNFGRIMDPLADKLLLVTLFISFVQLGFAPAWMVILIIGREFAITGLRVLAASYGQVIVASESGKHKTVSQIIAVIVILVINALISALRTFAPPWEFTLLSQGSWGEALLYTITYAPYACLFVAAVLSLYSGIEYLVQNWHLLKERS
jgi:CDP-diacylglycerol---glycerol-3-phosphate 3-phosphatidyltransferase